MTFRLGRVKTDRMFQRSSFRFWRHGRRPASKALAVVRTEPRRRAAGTKPEQDGQTELASRGCALTSVCEISRHLCQSPVGRGLEAGERPPGGLCPALPSPPRGGPVECHCVSLWGVPAGLCGCREVCPLCVYMGCVCGLVCKRPGVREQEREYACVTQG